MDIIKRIDDLRKERGWTKYRLAEEAMILYSTLAGIYARGTPPKIETLEMLCNAFGITLAQFFTENDDSEILNEKERQLIRLYRKLGNDKKQALLTIINND